MATDQEHYIYKSFLVLAALGRQVEVDHYLRRAVIRNAVYRVADELRNTSPPPLNPLFRGLLLEPPVSTTLSTIYRNASFVSFSEEHDVGCWFARPDSSLAGDYMALHPNATGWLATYQPTDASEILFHWSWIDAINQVHPNVYLTAQGMAMQVNENPGDWVMELHWNLQTQKEVMLKPGPVVNLTPVDNAGCPVAAILDNRYWPRPQWVRTQAAIAGIPARTKLNVVDVEVPSPPALCPNCHQTGVEIIYILERNNLRVYCCTICNNHVFAIPRNTGPRP